MTQILTALSTRVCYLSVMALFLIQVSCGYMPLTTSHMPDNWMQEVAQKQRLSAWKLTGHFGVLTENNGGSLDIFWNQQGDDYKIRMIAAMGQGAVLIRGNAHGVMLKTRDGESYAEDVDELLFTRLGMKVPLSGMHHWLRGIPVDGQPTKKTLWDEQGQLYKLVQDGWNIEMSAYKKVGDYILPHDFYLERDDQPELEIRFKIRQWTLLDKKTS